MPFFVYILYSETADKFYTGSCEDPAIRLKRHNHRSTASTKFGIPWEIVYTEEYKTKGEAIRRERSIKKMKSRKYIEILVHKEIS